MSTALAVIGPQQLSYTSAEELARSILSRMDSVAVKLRTLEDDIRRLWIEFDKLKDGKTILGCATKKEFCEKKLHRTPRAVRYMLDGGNPDNQKKEEKISPTAPKEPVRCPLCELILDSRRQLRKHGRDAHDIGGMDMAEFLRRVAGVCPSGKQGFASRDNGDGKSYFHCRQCGKFHLDRNQSHRAEAEPAGDSLDDVLEKLVTRIALQPYGYSATKFAAYPEQHTTDLAIIETTKREIWRQIVEIGQARLAAK